MVATSHHALVAAPAEAHADPTEARVKREPVPFSSLTSATPDSPTRTELRIDPYWTAMWGSGAQATWLVRKTAEAQAATGVGDIPYYLRPDRERALSRVGGNGRGQELRFDALAVLDSWRTVSLEQLSQITGHARMADPTSGVTGDLFELDLADVGLAATGLTHKKESRRATLLRPSQSSSLERKILPRLTTAERVGITGGQPIGAPGRQFDRHNLMAAELALRAAEYTDLGGALGEKLSTWQLLASSPSAGPYLSVGSQNAADATLIRTDGLRIAVEVTASVNDNFRTKVRRWAELLSHRRPADTGLVVLFVVVGRAKNRGTGGTVLRKARRVISDAARDWPGISQDRTAERMLLSAWEWWFPKPGHVDPGFLGLEVQRPTGEAKRRWETIWALETFDLPFEPTDPDGALSVLDNISAIRSVPHWLRRIDRAPDIAEITMRGAGFDEIPVPARPDGTRPSLGRRSTPPRLLVR